MRSRARAPRLKDIAEDLGLSIMAVSKALRGHTDIGVETRRRVVERALELNYSPNLLPMQMLTGRTRTIGMVIPSMHITYFGQLVHGVTVRTRQHGYQLLLCNSEGNPENEREQVRTLLARQVEGIILASAGPLRDRDELSFLLDCGIPYVLAGRGKPAFPANFLGSDGVAIGRAVTEHLIDQGYRRIAHIQGAAVAGSAQRREGYLQALAAHGRVVAQEYVAGPADGIEAGCAAMGQLMQCKPMPDAVFCYTDLVAGGAMRAILEAGLRIPADIALAGVGNLIFSDLLKIPLTTVEQHPQVLGEEAAALILAFADGKKIKTPIQRFVPFELVTRESTERRGRTPMQKTRRVS